MSSLTPAQLAYLDQAVAQSNPIVDELVQIADDILETEGAEAAVGVLATSFERKGELPKLATVAGIALVRLAQQKRGDRP